ncbi:MAG: S41 family peptidase [Bacteroidia bacterium]|nr:S41 family peptidase [Bacteroidia bacterium]
MYKPILPFLFLVLTATAFSQTRTNQTEFNFGFEKTTPGQKLPNGWFQELQAHITVDTITNHSGRNSLLIESLDSSSQKSFGRALYELPAIYSGKEIELRAFIKTKGVTKSSEGLSLVVVGLNRVLKEKRQSCPKGTHDWTMYKLKVPYPKNAQNIFIGIGLNGMGQIWIDDIELLMDGKDISQAIHIYKAEQDKEFDKGSEIKAFQPNEEKINDLKILGMVWGFLKYYHPNVAAGNYNWDYELFRVLPRIIDAKTSSDRDKILSDWIASLGTFKVGRPTKIKEEIKVSPDLDWITKSNLTADLTSQLIKVKNAERTDNHYYIGLFAGVRNPEFKNENAYNEMKYPDVGFRLLSLYRYWNIIQYYFPNRQLIGEDWKDVLLEFVPKFINATNELEYHLAALELIARIHDTHANIWSKNPAYSYLWHKYPTPVQLKFVDNQAVVGGYNNQELGEKSCLMAGDIITKINNIAIEDIIKEKLKYTPASNYSTQLRDMNNKLLRADDTIINIEYSRNGISRNKEIHAYPKIIYDPIIYKKDTCFKFINPDISYLYLGSIKNQYLPKIMNEVQQTKGLIIDLRCYPSEFVVFTLGKYLMPTGTPFVKFSFGSITNPGLFTRTPYFVNVGEENKDYYKGKVVILINELTQSQAEYTTMAFKVAPDATVIGSTTAGADGNVSEFYLPGGIETMISGIGVYYPDGRETQRVGIIPDIEVKPTIEGIRLGKDEVLEKAIDIINGK